MKTMDTNNHSEPSPELIDDIRKRLANLPQEILDRARHALMHEPIHDAGSILYKAGVCLGSHELYEYRKTLFPPNSLLDPCTAGSPQLADHGCAEIQPPSSQSIVPIIPDRSADSLSASNPAERGVNAASVTNEKGLHQARQSVVQLLAARAQQMIDKAQDVTSSSNSSKHNGQRTTDHGQLLNDLCDLIKRYVILPDMAAETLALWVVHTHAFTLRQVTTYIGVVSPEKRCGKTTLLELLRSLAHEAVAAANISPSALFRVIEDTKPTLLIDEADTFLHGRDEMAGILNAGYRKGNSYVVRAAEGKGRKNGLVKYSCWCPKVMAAIGRLPDTLADRCILITMQRKMPGEQCERLRELDATEYRQRCADFVKEHSDAIAKARPEIPSTLNDRAADIWEPLLAIADLAGGDWPELARQAAQRLSTQDDELTPIGYLLKDIRDLMLNSKVDRVLSRDIIRVLNPLHSRPWEDLRRGREINEWWLGRLLSGLGVRSKAMRIDDAVAKGYTLADIDAAFRRYVPNPDLHAAISSSSSSSSSIPSSAASEASDSDPKTEKDPKKFMRKLLGPSPPS